MIVKLSFRFSGIYMTDSLKTIRIMTVVNSATVKVSVYMIHRAFGEYSYFICSWRMISLLNSLQNSEQPVPIES